MSALHNDIIHPRVQGQDPERDFIEPYADRKARLISERPVPTNCAKPKAKRHDDEFRRSFCRLYREGLTHRRMALELSIARGSVPRFAKVFGLPPRYDREMRPINASDRYAITVRLTGSIDQKLTEHCGRLGKSRAAWIRSLIRNNLDMHS